MNPTDAPVKVALTPRQLDGAGACSPIQMVLKPGQQVWRTAQSMVSCIRPGAPNYTLNIKGVDGAVLVQSYYDYGNFIYATSPVLDVLPQLSTTDGTN